MLSSRSFWAPLFFLFLFLVLLPCCTAELTCPVSCQIRDKLTACVSAFHRLLIVNRFHTYFFLSIRMDAFLGIPPLKKIYLCRDEAHTLFTNDEPQDFIKLGVTRVKLIPGCECDIHLYHRRSTESLSPFEVKERSNNSHLLKSLLQKAVRRQDETIAHRAARDLMLLKPIDLIRRLPIIMIEDTTIFYEIVDMIFDVLSGTITEQHRPLQYATLLARTKKRTVPKPYTGAVTFKQESAVR